MSAGWSTPIFHCASVDGERSLKACCWDTIIWIFWVCPVIAGMSVL